MQDDHCSAVQPKTCLHLVVGAGRQALDDCLEQAEEGDSVLFLDAGVLHLLRTPLSPPDRVAVAIFYAAADLRAHGLLELARREGADIINDAGCCELLTSHRHSLTWR